MPEPSSSTAEAPGNVAAPAAAQRFFSGWHTAECWVAVAAFSYIAVILLLDVMGRELLGPADSMTPERLFNRRWALMLLERVMNRLRAECAAARKEALFDKLKDYLTGDAAAKSYREMAAELQLTEGAVKVTVHRLRRRFGELIREQIARTVETPEEIDDEIRELFAALS